MESYQRNLPRSFSGDPDNETPPRATLDGYYFVALKDRNFTDNRDSFPPDCALTAPPHSLCMRDPRPVNPPPEEKLDLLRRLDEFHFWHSLDDRRFCQQCRHSINGWQVRVMKLDDARGTLRLQCPTDGCLSTPARWIYADPILAAALRREFRSVGPQSPAAPEQPSLTHHGRVCSVRRPRRRYNENAGAASEPGGGRAERSLSFRAILARLPILRSVATGLHAFRPIA